MSEWQRDERVPCTTNGMANSWIRQLDNGIRLNIHYAWNFDELEITTFLGGMLEPDSVWLGNKRFDAGFSKAQAESNQCYGYDSSNVYSDDQPWIVPDIDNHAPGSDLYHIETFVAPRKELLLPEHADTVFQYICISMLLGM